MMFGIVTSKVFEAGDLKFRECNLKILHHSLKKRS